MKKTLLFALAAVFAASHVTAQDWAKPRLEKSPRHGEWVKVKHDSRELESFITYPEVKDKATAVVIIYDIHGLSDWARGITDQLAEAGYIAICPDLLSGMGPKGGGTKDYAPSDLSRAVFGLQSDQVVGDVSSVVDYVSKLPSCNGKVVVMGFCWGGGQAFNFATKNKDIKATLSFYGNIPTDDAALARINAPVYGFYGQKDNRITGSVPKGIEQMKAAGKFYEPVIYDGASHGFMYDAEDTGSRDQNHAANIKAREDAWKRLREILQKI